MKSDTRASFVLGAIIGGVLSALLSVWMVFVKAPAAVRVRPRLESVGFASALFSNHGGDWLFYHHPTAAAIGTVVSAALLAGVAFAVSA